ncbi:MAG: hypothetical protein AAF642_12970 [Pseudomonadota bacterium]
MALVLAMTILAAILGAVLPTRWGAIGILVGASVVFAIQVAINTVSGFAGSSLEESLLLFNGSYLSYLGFNVQITYRAFAFPLLALALVYTYRLKR